MTERTNRYQDRVSQGEGGNVATTFYTERVQRRLGRGTVTRLFAYVEGFTPEWALIPQTSRRIVVKRGRLPLPFAQKRIAIREERTAVELDYLADDARLQREQPERPGKHSKKGKLVPDIQPRSLHFLDTVFAGK